MQKNVNIKKIEVKKNIQLKTNLSQTKYAITLKAVLYIKELLKKRMLKSKEN